MDVREWGYCESSEQLDDSSQLSLSPHPGPLYESAVSFMYFASWSLLDLWVLQLMVWWRMWRCSTKLRPWASQSLQQSLQTHFFVVLPLSPYLHCTHYLQTESRRDSCRERVGCPHQDRSSLSAGHKGPCCLCGFPWVSVLVWRRRRISAVSLLHLHSSSFRCCGDLRRGILARCWWREMASSLGFGCHFCFMPVKCEKLPTWTSMTPIF